jgi:hypothetical protein
MMMWPGEPLTTNHTSCQQMHVFEACSRAPPDGVLPHGEDKHSRMFQAVKLCTSQSQTMFMTQGAVYHNFDKRCCVSALLQVVQPNPANKHAYQEALQRHMQRGQRLFAPQQ